MTELFIQKNEKNKKIALVENGKLIEYYEEKENSNRKEGNIYIGIVKDIVVGMQAAFVDIGTEKNSFIYVQDILPKVDQVKGKENNIRDIRDVVKQGDKILVQVKKDSNDKKGARISTHINLPGKFIALLPETSVITVSRKIADETERDRLKEIVKNNIDNKNGAIIRTSAEGKEKEIIEDIKYLEQKWKLIEEKSKDMDKTGLVYNAESIEERIVIDFAGKRLDRIIVNNEEDFENIKKIKDEKTNIELLQNEEIITKYDLEKEIEKINNRKIWLKSGGFITIDRTEALTAIDVNTGKFTGKKELEETVFKTNREATLEIAKQLRLRDIGGIIIIDYIDMRRAEHKESIEKLLNEKLKEDRAKTQVEGFTKLNLMEMTRKHICSHEPERGEK